MSIVVLRVKTALRWLGRGPLLTAIVAVGLAAPVAASTTDLTQAEAENAVGDTAREVESGAQEDLIAVTLDRGRTLFTHGPDTRASLDGAGTGLGPGDPERAPVCATDYYQHVLYARPATAADRLATATPQIQGIVRRMNALLNDEAMESGSKHADYKVRCDSGGQVKVDGLVVPAAGPGLAPDMSFEGVASAADAAGFRSANVDYTIFVDGVSPEDGVCGVGSYYTDQSLSSSNANNNPSGAGSGYAVVYSAPRSGSSYSCWEDETPMHENGHNQGAVQYSAPDSTGTGGHCNDLIDVMCYAPDGGNLRQTEVTNCAQAVHFDCDHDTYFDAAPESGEYLASNWNLGSPLNRFIAFSSPVADTTPPTVSLSDVPSPSTDATPTFSGQAEAGRDVTVTVRDDGGSQVASPSVTPNGSGAYSVELTSALDPGDYSATAAQTDTAGNTGTSPERSFTIEALQTSESTDAPDSAQAVRGKVTGGNVVSLQSDDGNVFKVKDRKQPQWQASFDDVPDDLVSLSVRFRGSSSKSCTQTMSLYDWRLGAFVALDQRGLGSSEQEIDLDDIDLAGDPRDYVSGDGGSGTVRLRFSCRARRATLSTDLLEITYDHP